MQVNPQYAHLVPVNVNQRIYDTMSASFNGFTSRIQAVTQLFDHVVLQGNHDTTSILQFRFHQDQLGLEAKQIRTTIDQALPYTGELAYVAAKQYVNQVNSLYVHIATKLLALLQLREETITQTSTREKEGVCRTSTQEALIALQGLQKLRMDSILASSSHPNVAQGYRDICSDMQLSLNKLATEIANVWNNFQLCAIDADFRPSSLLQLELSQNQVESDAKQARLVIRKNYPRVNELAHAAAGCYGNLLEGLQASIDQSAVRIEASYAIKSSESFQQGAEIAQTVVNRFNAMAMDVS